MRWSTPIRCGSKWVFTGSYRYYTQNAADFYSDLFPQRELPELHGARQGNRPASRSHTLGVGASYEFPVTWLSWLKKGTVNLPVNHMMFDYDDFRDLHGLPAGTAEPGTEPLYSLDANVIQFFVSFWF